MQKTCTNPWCKASFEITADDLAFYDKVSPVFSGKKYSIPPPSLCPDCRLRERLIWRPELHIHMRKSDKTGKAILSMYAPDADCVVFEPDEWWKDDWSALDYGRDVDFSRPFFDQFEELLHSVPLIALSQTGNVNCDYVNSASWNRNCYLISAATHNEDCYYGNFLNHCMDCLDCSFIDYCELCYECIDCSRCSNLRHSQYCSNCSDSFFLFNCKGCRNCFGSVNAVEKKYLWLNEQLSKEEYERRLSRSQLHCRTRVEEAATFFERHRLNYPQKHMFGEMNQNVTGNSIFRSKNAFHCFDVSDVEDCSYCSWFHHAKDCMDCYSWGFPAEECYMCLEVGDNSHRVLFSATTYNGSNCLYSYQCRNSRNLFGCVSLHHQDSCILNKRYEKSEYENLAIKLIEHMQRTGEWGSFFPMRICPIAYNQAICQDAFPLTREEAQHLGARWQEESLVASAAEVKAIPDSIDDASEDICNTVLTCEETGKPYHIIVQELRFLKTHKIPIPAKSWFTRHMKRLGKRNPRMLWHRQCAKCQKPIQTTYAPERPEVVYCEQCYLNTVY